MSWNSESGRDHLPPQQPPPNQGHGDRSNNGCVRVAVPVVAAIVLTGRFALRAMRGR